MVRKLLVAALVTALELSACSGQAPPATITPTPTQTQTSIPVVTETPALVETPQTQPVEEMQLDIADNPLPTVTATSISTPAAPTNSPDCTNSATFVADVTIPDLTNFVGGTTFTKTWRIRNTGTCVWGPDYKLVNYSEETMGAPGSVPLDVTLPGQTLDISVDMIAPNRIGKHRGNFVIKNPRGLIMRINDDSRVWIIINVTDKAAATSASASAATNAPLAATASLGDFASTAAACALSTDSSTLTSTLNAVNAYRAEKGLPPYTVNEKLARAAQAHANDMACNRLFVHTGSDGSTPQSRAAATGYAASSLSENVYGSYPPLSADEVVDWWINDKTDLNHNRNLLSNSFTELGVGYAFFDNYGYYVLVFAKP